MSGKNQSLRDKCTDSGAVRARKEPHAVSNDEERHPHVRSNAHPKGDEPQGGENEKDRLGRQGKDDE
jgi:hypothetical protein